MTLYAFTDEVRFSGDWFLPPMGDAAPIRIAGTLAWTNRAARLELHDAFEPMNGTIFGLDDVDPQPVIHGETTSSDLVSLLEALPIGRRFAIGEAGVKQAQSFIASWCVIGAHVNAETCYEELRVRIPGLSMWLNSSGTTLNYQFEPGFKVVYEVEGGIEEEVIISSRALKLLFENHRTCSSPTDAEFSIKSSGFLRIIPDEPQTLEWLFHELSKATTLLSILAGSSMSPDLATANIAGGEQVHVLVELRADQHCAFQHMQEFFMLQNTMEASLGNVFDCWYNLFDKVELPSQLALSVFGSSGLWNHVEFLSLMQALEGLHRALMPGLYVPIDEYNKIAGAMNAAIPTCVQSDHRDSLKGRIKYGNEFSLRKRLKALIDPLPISIRQLILGGPNVPGRWIDTRNYYTHWDDAARAGALNELEMHRAGVRMKLLLRVLYLQLVGIPESALLKGLTGANRDSQYLLQLNALRHRQSNPGSTAGALGKIAYSPSTSATTAESDSTDVHT